MGSFRERPAPIGVEDGMRAERRDLSGQRLGDDELRRVLGRGTTGEVYEAVHSAFSEASP